MYRQITSLNHFEETLKKGDVNSLIHAISNGFPVYDCNEKGINALDFIAASKDIQIATFLRDKKIDVKVKNIKGITPFHYAILAGNIQFLKVFSDELNSEGLKDDSGRTFLHYAVAVAKGDIEVIELLLERGANLEILDKDCFTPLHIAVRKGNIDIIKFLLNKGANVDSGRKPYNVEDHSGDDYDTPLHIAVKKGDIEVIELLLERGANLEILDKDCFTPLHIAVHKGNIDLINFLLDKGANIDSGRKPYVEDSNFYSSPLHVAVRNGNIEVINVLLGRGANLDIFDDEECSPLHVAVEKENIEIIDLLLNRGADISGAKEIYRFSDRERFFSANIDLLGTPLHHAVEYGDIKIAEHLLKRGAIIDAFNRFGYTPLHIAVEQGNFDIINLLLQNGASREERSADSKTPLYFAKDLKTANYLLSLGSDLYARAEEVLTILQNAAQQGYLEIFRFALRRGLSINERDIHGNTLLHLASRNGHIEVVKEIIEMNAPIDIEAVNYDRCTALSEACKQKKVEVIEILLKQGAKVNLSGVLRSPLLAVFKNKSYGYSKKQEEIIKLLIKYGANPNHENNFITPLQIAALNREYSILEIMMEQVIHNLKEEPKKLIYLLLRNFEEYCSFPFLLNENSASQADKLIEFAKKNIINPEAHADIITSFDRRKFLDISVKKFINYDLVESNSNLNRLPRHLIIEINKFLGMEELVRLSAYSIGEKYNSIKMPVLLDAALSLDIAGYKIHRPYKKHKDIGISIYESMYVYNKEIAVNILNQFNIYKRESHKEMLTFFSIQAAINSVAFDILDLDKGKLLSCGDPQKQKIKLIVKNKFFYAVISKEIAPSHISWDNIPFPFEGNKAGLLLISENNQIALYNYVYTYYQIIRDIKSSVLQIDNKNFDHQESTAESTDLFLESFLDHIFLIKSIDLTLDTLNIYYEPTIENAKALVIDYAHLQMMFQATYSAVGLSILEVTKSIYDGNFEQAGMQIFTSLSYSAIPIMGLLIPTEYQQVITSIYAGVMIVHNLSNLANKVYNFDHTSSKAQLKSALAYGSLYLKIGFSSWAQDKVEQAVNIMNDNQNDNELWNIASEYEMCGLIKDLGLNSENCIAL